MGITHPVSGVSGKVLVNRDGVCAIIDSYDSYPRIRADLYQIPFDHAVPIKKIVGILYLNNRTRASGTRLRMMFSVPDWSRTRRSL